METRTRRPLPNIPAYRLILKSVEAKLEEQYNDNEERDPVALVKIFNPAGGQTWYVFGWDGCDTLYNLLHQPGGDSLGYASLNEMRSLRVMGGMLGLERDLHWKPMRLSEIREKLESGQRP